MSSPITTHVLDTALGKPAAGIAISLDRRNGNEWTEIGSGITNTDGRLSDLLDSPLESAHYRLNFATETYFTAQGIVGFYPVVRIEFLVAQPGQHYHVPLLLSPFGYATYRGS